MEVTKIVRGSGNARKAYAGEGQLLLAIRFTHWQGWEAHESLQ